MNLQVPLKPFSDALATVSRATGGKHLRPILANVLLVAEGDELRLVGTDLEIMVISRLKAEIAIPGKCTISAKLLTEIVSTFPIESEKAVVKLEKKEDQENSIIVASGRVKSSIPMQGVEEYPPVPEVENESFPNFEHSCSVLRKALREVATAMAVEESNPTQRSVCFNFSKGDLRLIATDSRRLAVTSLLAISYPQEFEKTHLVPSRAVPEILKVLETVEKVNVGLYKEQLVFTTADFVLLTRLYDGKFPDYQRILPKECSRKLTMKHKDFLQALRSVNPIARHSSSMVHLDVGSNETRIWAESKEEGNSEVFISTRLDGEPISIAFNGKYLQDFLGVADCDEISLELTTPNYPGVLKPLPPENPFNYVIMPMTM